MQSNIEIEAKVLLSEEQYRKLVSHLNLQGFKRVKQVNHYIDNDQRDLKHNDMALRVREKDDFVLSLKTPLSEGLLEKKQALSWREYDNLEDDGIFPEGTIKDFLKLCSVDVDSLKIIATLTTYRFEFKYEDTAIDLDENFYGKQEAIHDYELEVITNSMKKAEEVTTKLLSEAGINEFTFNKHSKQVRATEAIN